MGTDRTLELDDGDSPEPQRTAADNAGFGAADETDESEEMVAIPTFLRHPQPDEAEVGDLYRLTGRDHLYRISNSGPVAVADETDESPLYQRRPGTPRCRACTAMLAHTLAFHRMGTGESETAGAADDAGTQDDEPTYGGDDEYSQVTRRPAPGARSRRR